jgi:hypothetical protein
MKYVNHFNKKECKLEYPDKDFSEFVNEWIKSNKEHKLDIPKHPIREWLKKLFKQYA